MKPKVFLSHSKKDKELIEKLANDLRSCGVDVWYDEWEIPPGESIRKKIFEEGITSCDLFFVYLTENSIPSYWVQKELDGALIHEIESQKSFLILYVSEDKLRSKLSIDLKALNIPRLNEEDYLIPFGKLLSRVWNAYSKNQLNKQLKEHQYQLLEVQKDNSDLERKILQLERNTKIDLESVKKELRKLEFSHNDIDKNLLEIVSILKNDFANGIFYHNLRRKIRDIFQVEDGEGWIDDGKPIFDNKYEINDFTGKLIILGLVEMKTSNDLDRSYSFTNQGIEFINSLEE